MPPIVRKVRVLIHRAGAGTAPYSADLLYIGSVPHVVFEWVTVGKREKPLVTVALNPAHLHEVRSGAADMIYDEIIKDPRRFS